MAMLSVSCRLKTVVSVSNVNEILRSVLIKTNTEAGRTFLTGNGGTIGLDRGEGDTGRGHRSRNTEDVSRNELCSRKLFNGESVSIVSSWRDVSANHRDGSMETTRLLGGRAFLSSKGSPIPQQVTLPMILGSWKSSKELDPSTGQSFLFARKLSSSSNVCFPTGNRERSSMRREDLCRRTSRRDDFRRRYSCKNTNQSDQCDDRKPKRRDPADCPDSDSSKLSATEFYPECSDPCKPSVEDPCCPPCPPPVCSSPKFYSPCPSVEDYCPKQEMVSARFWRCIVIFIVLPLVLAASCFVYTREMECRKKPRLPFVDVPYLRRITKPFPWGDGKHSLFHNPVKNPISPHGYEVEDPNEVKTSQPKD